MSVTIVCDDAAKTFCALFHDKEDGPAFGRLICSELLSAFTQEYSSSDFGHFGTNLKDFHGFHDKISEVIRNSVKPVLTRLQDHRGIKRVLLVTDDGAVISPNTDIDQLSLLANIQTLTILGSQISEFISKH